MKKYIFAVFVAVLSVTCFASYSFGLDEESEKEKLKALHSCFNCDLKMYDMDGSDLRFANFARSNLTRASIL